MCNSSTARVLRIPHVNADANTRPRPPEGRAPDAVPTILPNFAPYLSKRLPPERNARNRMLCHEKGDGCQLRTSQMCGNGLLLAGLVSSTSARRTTTPLERLQHREM
ncbi:hypothetical protein HPB50_000190 [Hyalomma asiaticum]|uniref:Uncharacterized protein n=1 Tax=Hyalomma asiaticum TaxID=266040 RepID=A0ACB7S6A7_HYAAI|nr:hypothetical protein HPB50_000190 [Hyalomma asiaticum]